LGLSPSTGGDVAGVPTIADGQELVKEEMMEERKTMEHLDAHMGWLDAMMEDEAALPSTKMHELLHALRRVRAEAQQTAAPFNAIIKAEQAKMTEAIAGLVVHEATIKAAMQGCLEESFEHDNWKYEGEAGTAQIVRPKPTISYDKKGLETLRLSLPAVDDLIGHLRTEEPRDPYLRVKLKKAE